MTPPVDPSGHPPALLPLDEPGRLFLLCDLALADPVMNQPAQWADLLLRLGLVDAPPPTAPDALVDLSFGGAMVTMVRGGAARTLLDDSLSANDAMPPAQARGLSSGIVMLELRGAKADRTTHAQRLCAVAALLAPLVGLKHLYWQPARLWSTADALAPAVRAMEASGVPPILHLIDFAACPRVLPGTQRLTTRGLAWFTGFEMVIDAPAAMPFQEVTRRAARLAIDSLLNGDPVGPVDLAGLTSGEIVAIAALQWIDGGWQLPVTVTGWRAP